MEIIASLSIYFFLRWLVVGLNEKREKRVTKRARERYQRKRNLENHGYTVISNPYNGEIEGYQKSRHLPRASNH